LLENRAASDEETSNWELTSSDSVVVQFDPTAGSGSESSIGPGSSSLANNRPRSAREQLFGTGIDDDTLLAIGSRDPSPQLSPVYSNHSVSAALSLISFSKPRKI